MHCHRFLPQIRSFRALLTLVLLLAAAGPALAESQIVVRLASGREFRAEVSPQTDNDRLWLSFRSGSAELLRPIHWDAVASANVDGQELTSAELRDRVLSGAHASLVSLQQEDAVEQPAEELPAPAPLSNADEAHEFLFGGPTTQNVQFDAYVVNWDGDVETDGLLINVRPLDETGRVVPVKGHLEAELFVEKSVSYRNAPRFGGSTAAYRRGLTRPAGRIDRAGRWVRQVTPVDIAADGAWYKLPFQATHPDFDAAVENNGLVHVRLVVPGCGVYDASLDVTRLRAYSPIRNTLQRIDGGRFFASERTGRSKR